MNALSADAFYVCVYFRQQPLLEAAMIGIVGDEHITAVPSLRDDP